MYGSQSTQAFFTVIQIRDKCMGSLIVIHLSLILGFLKWVPRPKNEGPPVLLLYHPVKSPNFVKPPHTVKETN